jgi:hypothetical protein
MRLSRFLFAAPLIASVLLAGSPAEAQGDDTDDFLKPDNWEGLNEYWKIDGTTIIGEAKKDPGFNTFFVTKKKYGDFELSFRVELKDGKGNSGVQVRSTVIDPKKYIVAGPQPDIGQQYWGSVYGERVGGMMKAAPPDLVKKVVKPADFNDYVIIAKGNRMTTRINGETMVDEEFPTTPDKKPLLSEGVIAIQLHAGGPMTVTLKEIKFKDLSKK